MSNPSIHELAYTVEFAGNRPRNKDLGLAITNYCQVPHKSLVINNNGQCYICQCESFLPIPVGDIETFEKLEDIWNSPISKCLQDDIDAKKYTHCAVDRCGILKGNMVKEKFHVSINIDNSCNLRCPSCRTTLVMHTRGKLFDDTSRRVNHIVKLLNNFDKPCEILMSGGGDPLASIVMRPFVYDLKLKENQDVILFTNGLMIKSHLPKSNIVDRIRKYQISIDAGSKEIYEKVRLGGNFDSLIENLDYLFTVTKDNNAHVLLFFCCQQKNHGDMFNFIDLCKHYGFDGLITRLENWDTWPSEGDNKFSDHDVISNDQHPDHKATINNLVKIYRNLDTRDYLDSHVKYLLETKFTSEL